MSRTLIEHVVITLIAQVVSGLFLGDWAFGAALACGWWLGREHAQAEYRWISWRGKGKRSNMPWWGGFDPAVWNRDSVLDWAAPLACAVLLYVLTQAVGA